MPAAATCAFVDVAAAVELAARNATVTIPAGSANWSSGVITLTKGIKLIGAGRDSTVITSTSSSFTTPIIYIQPDATAQSSGDEFRIEGFTFDGSDVGGTSNAIAGNFLSASINLVVGNNRFRNFGPGTSVLKPTGQTRGVIYSNLFEHCDMILRPLGYDSVDEWLTYPFSFGMSDSLFFEDNHISWPTTGIPGGTGPGWIEVGQSSHGIVIRYNQWDFANAEQTSNNECLDVHGYQNWTPGHQGETGNMVAEMYGNTILHSAANRTINHRGSWGLFFNNLVSTGSDPVNGTGPNVISASQYGIEHAGIGGSGCQVDVAGVDARVTFLPEINNTYVFNNTVNAVVRNMTPGPVYGCGIAENTNYYNLSPSFDGSTGIGIGSSTPAMSATNGVAYWKTATTTPTVDSAVNQASRLYKRVSGAWVNYYQPYTYPHPLRTAEDGGGTGGATAAHIILR